MLPRLAIFGGFDNIVSINLKNWLFDVFCGLCIFAHLRLQTSFFWLWKMAGFCMIYLSRICRFMAIKPPKYFSCRIFFCHFAKLSTPKTQLCIWSQIFWYVGGSEKSSKRLPKIAPRFPWSCHEIALCCPVVVLLLPWGCLMLQLYSPALWLLFSCLMHSG